MILLYFDNWLYMLEWLTIIFSLLYELLYIIKLFFNDNIIIYV
jgi:hypothetical protein